VAAPPEPVDAAQAAAPAGTAAPEPAPSPTLVIADLTFTPAILEVVPGATVRVENRDAFPHSVTSESARGAFAPGAVANVQFDTGVFGVGARTFTVPPEAQPGTVIPFYCSVHKGSMRTPDGELRIVERR
jgi:plastocyanin